MSTRSPVPLSLSSPRSVDGTLATSSWSTSPRSITGNAGLVEFALASVMKDLTKSSTLRQAFASAMSGVTPGGHPVGPGSSLSNQFDVHDNVFQVQDPRDMGRKLAVIARRKNAVRT